MVKGTLFLDAADQAQLEECDIAFVIGLKRNDGGTRAQIMELGGEGMATEGVRKCLADCIVHIVEHLSEKDDPSKAIMHLLCFTKEINVMVKDHIAKLVAQA